MEPLLSELLRDWGFVLLCLSWSDSEVNAACSYVRKAVEQDILVGDAVKEVYLMRKQGRLTPNEQ